MTKKSASQKSRMEKFFFRRMYCAKSFATRISLHSIYGKKIGKKYFWKNEKGNNQTITSSYETRKSIKKSVKNLHLRKVEWRNFHSDKCIVQSHLQPVFDCIRLMVMKLVKNIFGKTKKVTPKPEKNHVKRATALRNDKKVGCLEKSSGEIFLMINVLCKVVCNAYLTAHKNI